MTLQIPYAAKDLREAFQKAMKLAKEEGAKWSSEREKAIKNDEYTPNDILHHTLQLQGTVFTRLQAGPQIEACLDYRPGQKGCIK